MDVAVWDLERLVGRGLGEGELLEYLPKLKCEVEEIAEGLVVYEATHDRPDLFSAEGLGRALEGLLGIEAGLREFSIEREVLSLDARGPEYRPYVAGAVVEGLSLDDEAVRQLMNLQEKLHATYCRNRRKVSIGLYDLDKIEPPIKYVAVEPHSVRFTPLGETREMDLAEVLKETEKGREFGHLLAGHGKYPLLVDSEGIVLSLPPIINSEDTRVTPDTRDVVVDVTSTDLRTALKVLLLLGCGAAALFYLQRRRHRKGPGGERIKSLGFLPVGGKERILLLEVMGEKVLVGVTENQITLLSHLSGRKSPFNPRSGLDEVEETAPLCFEYEEDEVKEWRSLPEVMKSFEEKIREFRRGQ